MDAPEFIRTAALPFEDPLIYRNSSVTLRIDGKDLGAGTLCLSAGCLGWRMPGRADFLAIPWKRIVVHALTNDPLSSVYVMVDVAVEWPGVLESHGRAINGNGLHEPAAAAANNDNQPGAAAAAGVADDDGDADDVLEVVGLDMPPLSELYFVPSDLSEREHIYLAMNDCQALNPDDDEDDMMHESDDDGDGFVMAMRGEVADEFVDVELQAEDNGLAENGDGANGVGEHRLRDLNLNNDDDERYADAD